MINGKFENSSFGDKILLLLLIFIGCFAAALVVCGICITLGMDMKLMQGLSSIISFALPAFIIATLYSQQKFHYLGFAGKSACKTYVTAFVLMLILIPFINLTGWLNEQVPFPHFMTGLETWMRQLEESTQAQLQIFLEVKNIDALLLNLLIIALLPAICEEMFFRGTIQKILLGKFNSHLAIWLTAIIFSFIHFQFFGFLPRLLLGALLGYIFAWSGNLWLSVLAHFANNATMVILYYLHYNKILNIDIDNIGIDNQWFVGIISAITGLFFIWILR
ncbi:MAG: CPBP family intramembrane metalloprotease, partial [Paludibacter sp.]|nr:CPBP family intramembrane metalloprotease [Paludibacter sp.]